MLHKFRGRGKWPEFLAELEKADQEGGTISPGGAAMMLRCSRQRVYQIVDEQPEVRAWAFFEPWSRNPSVYEVSVPDLVAYAVRVRGVRSRSDLGLSDWPRIAEVLQRELEKRQVPVVE